MSNAAAFIDESPVFKKIIGGIPELPGDLIKSCGGMLAGSGVSCSDSKSGGSVVGGLAEIFGGKSLADSPRQSAPQANIQSGQSTGAEFEAALGQLMSQSFGSQMRNSGVRTV